MPDWTNVARSLARDGATHDEVARRLIAAGATPIDAIKAIRTVFAVSLGTAKTFVHRNLSPDQQGAATGYGTRPSER